MDDTMIASIHRKQTTLKSTVGENLIDTQQKWVVCTNGNYGLHSKVGSLLVERYRGILA